MQEYWVNVYEWSGDPQKPRRKIVGLQQKFNTKIDSDLYIASVGLYRVYRIHVKMKPLYIQSFGRAKRLPIHEKWLEL